MKSRSLMQRCHPSPRGRPFVASSFSTTAATTRSRSASAVRPSSSTTVRYRRTVLMSVPRRVAMRFFASPARQPRRTSLISSTVTPRNAMTPPGPGQHPAREGHSRWVTRRGGKVLKNPARRGGKVLKNSGGRGPYLMKTDKEGTVLEPLELPAPLSHLPWDIAQDEFGLVGSDFIAH